MTPEHKAEPKSVEEIVKQLWEARFGGQWEAMETGLRQEVVEAIQAEREIAENDYKDMRRMQSEFMRVDHELRDLKERQQAQHTLPSWHSCFEWIKTMPYEISPKDVYDWLTARMKGQDEKAK